MDLNQLDPQQIALAMALQQGAGGDEEAPSLTPPAPLSGPYGAQAITRSGEINPLAAALSGNMPDAPMRMSAPAPVAPPPQTSQAPDNQQSSDWANMMASSLASQPDATPAQAPTQTAAAASSDTGTAPAEDATTGQYRAMHDQLVAQYSKLVAAGQQAAAAGRDPAPYFKMAEEAADQANKVNLAAIEYGKPEAPAQTVKAGDYVRQDDGSYKQIGGGKEEAKAQIIGEDMYGNKRYAIPPPVGSPPGTPWKPIVVEGDQAGGAASAPQNLDLHGADYIQTLPPQIAGQVTAIVQGRAPYPTGMLLRTPYGQQLAAMVTQADPTFEAGNATARVKVRNEFESGGPNSVAGTITAGNAAIQHLGELSDAAENLGNRSVPVWNAIANTWETNTGDARVTNFNNVVARFGEEATKFYRGIGGSEADVQRDIANINPNMSPVQLRGAIQTQANLMRDKINTLESRWTNAMGPLVPLPGPIVTPITKRSLDKIDTRAFGGTAPNAPQSTAPAGAPPGPAPPGKVWKWVP